MNEGIGREREERKGGTFELWTLSSNGYIFWGLYVGRWIRVLKYFVDVVAVRLND